jgi:hypothetical protein
MNDLEKRTLVVGHSKSEAGIGRAIRLNVTPWQVLVRWAGRYPDALPEHYVFPGCQSKRIDPTRRGAGDQNVHQAQDGISEASSNVLN